MGVYDDNNGVGKCAPVVTLKADDVGPSNAETVRADDGSWKIRKNAPSEFRST